jgi:hypothetical protein
MSRNENDDHFRVLLKRVEVLAIENNALRMDVRRAERTTDEQHGQLLQLTGAHERLEQAVAEIERLRKRHPRLVRLPAFMKPDYDDIPF